MDRLDEVALTARMTTTSMTSNARPDARSVARAIERRSYAVISTVSPAGRPHGAGILCSPVDGRLHFSTLRSSRKGRNLLAHPWAAVTIPVRRLPVGPPSGVHFQARAEVLDLDDPEVRALADAGALKAITSHGELELAGGCIVRLTPVGRVHTYGLGLSLRRLIADPLSAGGSVELPRR
jgi:hypothetical protein